MRQVWSQILVWMEANGRLTAAGTVGHLIWPGLHAPITQPFGPSPYGFEPSFQGFPHFHTGVDLGGPAGTPILAAADGIVALATSDGIGYGNYVVIVHDGGLTTLYGHLAVIGVKAGDQVHQGQPIGAEGSTGNSTGPHLHFEVRVNGQIVDPMPYLPPADLAAG
jgi:murein DD-endopeptidase MepM/ murein hydrolase activator NlpD